MGRRRLLRLLPAARRPLGHPDRRRQRPRHPRRRDDGGHAQPRPHPTPARPTRRRDCSSTSTSTWPRRYTSENEAFVTAFYGIYDPATRELTYASAGHNPPRLKRCADGSRRSLDGVGSLPLGVFDPTRSTRRPRWQLRPGDQIVFYTDGITEAENDAGEMFGLERLDRVLADCAIGAGDLLREVLRACNEFTAGRPLADDRTVLVAKVS